MVSRLGLYGGPRTLGPIEAKEATMANVTVDVAPDGQLRIVILTQDVEFKATVEGNLQITVKD